MGITRGKSFDQTVRDLVVDRGFNFTKMPGVSPALSVSTPR
jgi:hypothetical protein